MSGSMSCARCGRSKGQTQTLPVTHGADVIVMTCISAGLARAQSQSSKLGLLGTYQEEGQNRQLGYVGPGRVAA